MQKGFQQLGVPFLFWEGGGGEIGLPLFRGTLA